MTSVPRINVVLATNRNSPYMREALATVAEQTFTDWDLTVVDNGVPDKDLLSRQLLAFPNTTLISAPASTVALARNVGIGMTRGEFLVFHDDDDVWVPSRLERQIEALERSPDAPAAFVGGWHMNSVGERFGPAFAAVPSTAAEVLSGRKDTPHILGTLLVRRSACIAVGGFSPELSIMEDFEFMLRLLWHGDFVAVPGEFLGYRRHRGNITNNSPTNVRVRRQVMRRSIDRLHWAAELRGDTVTAQLLGEYLKSFTDRSAQNAGQNARRYALHGKLSDAMQETLWGLRRAPGHFARGLVLPAAGAAA